VNPAAHAAAAASLLESGNGYNTTIHVYPSVSPRNRATPGTTRSATSPSTATTTKLPNPIILPQNVAQILQRQNEQFGATSNRLSSSSSSSAAAATTTTTTPKSTHHHMSSKQKKRLNARHPSFHPKASFIVNSTLLHEPPAFAPIDNVAQAANGIAPVPVPPYQVDLLGKWVGKVGRKIALGHLQHRRDHVSNNSPSATGATSGGINNSTAGGAGSSTATNSPMNKRGRAASPVASMGTFFAATKVRLISQWMLKNISYDESGLLAGTQHTEPKSVLRHLHAGPEGFANLFVKLCSVIGIEALKIKGYAKGFTYQTGKSIRHVNHAWNAVRLGKTWYLIDILWGAGVMKGVHFERMYQTNHYFLTDPRLFILDHFPINSKWQLLDPAITRQEWDQLVRPEYGAFQYDIQTTHRFAVINCADPALVLPFYSTKMTGIQVLVSVQPEVESSSEFFNEDKFVHVQRFEHGLKVWILFPFAGVYTMHLYVRDLSQKHVKGDYVGAYTYHIVSRGHLDYNVGWVKANPLLSEYNGRIECPLQGYIMRNCTERFRVYLPAGFSAAAVNMGGGSKWVHLKSLGGKVYQIDTIIKSSASKSVTLHGYSSTLDSWVVLASYHACNDFPDGTNDWRHIKWNKNLPFLIDSDDGVDYNSDTDIDLEEKEENTTPFIFPEKTEQFKIKLLSHPNRRVKADKSAGVTIRLQCERDDVLLRPMKLRRFGTELSNNTTWIVRSGKMIYFKVVCPSEGRFLFPIEISNKVNAFEEPEFESVVGLEYEIDANDYEGPEKHEFCFPRVYDTFNDSKCILYAPFKKLLTNRSYEFKIKVPNAEYVAIINSGQWTYLSRTEDDMYVAEVFIVDSEYPEVTLTARLTTDPPEDQITSFPRYLDFFVVRKLVVDDVFDLITPTTPINMPQIYSQYVTICDPHYKHIECGVLDQKLVLFRVNTTAQQSPHGNMSQIGFDASRGSTDNASGFFLESTMYDELREIPRATLVLHNVQKKEIAVLFMAPTDGQYCLKIRLITVESQEMTEYEGLSFWIEAGKVVKKKRPKRSKSAMDTKLEQNQRSASLPEPTVSDIEGLPPLSILDEAAKSSSPTDPEEADHTAKDATSPKPPRKSLLNGIVQIQRRSNSLPHGEMERGLAEERVRQMKAQKLKQNSWKNRRLAFGYVKVEGMAYYRPHVYFPLLSYLVRDQVHSIKISVCNTSGVVCCSHNDKYDTYLEFQSLENDDLNDPTMWYGEASFSAPATEVLVMACVDTTHYCPIATYKLVDGEAKRKDM